MRLHPDFLETREHNRIIETLFKLAGYISGITTENFIKFPVKRAGFTVG